MDFVLFFPLALLFPLEGALFLLNEENYAIKEYISLSGMVGFSNRFSVAFHVIFYFLLHLCAR